MHVTMLALKYVSFARTTDYKLLSSAATNISTTWFNAYNRFILNAYGNFQPAVQ